MRLKYGNVRTYSTLCNRWFSSKLEATRGEQLRLMEMAGEISDLEYQISFKLCNKPKLTLTVDFGYSSKDREHIILEDVKGYKETREFRVKRLWLKEKYGIEVKLIRKEDI